VKTLPLSFELDQTSEGSHQVRLYFELDGVRELVSDPLLIARYGYKKVVETPDAVTTYVLDPQDWETLLALKSMNPRREADKSALVFDFAPAILLHMRQNANVKESDESRQIKISQRPLRPMAVIDFDPTTGITVETGFAVPHEEKLVHTQELAVTPDKSYAQVGNTFYRVPQNVSNGAQKWLKQATHTVSIGQVPEFYVRDLAPLQEEMAAVLTDRMLALRVMDVDLKPIVYLDAKEKGWLSFNVAYGADDQQISHASANDALRNAGYVRNDDFTWFWVDPQTVKSVQSQIDKLNIRSETNIEYRLQASEFASLEEFVGSIGGTAVLSNSYQVFMDQLTGFQTNEAFQLSPVTEAYLKTQHILLRPYQRAGIHWLTWLHENHLHGLLADDMGLGKTLQSILTLSYAYERSATHLCSLVIAPNSVLTHWEGEITRFFPKMRTYRYHGPNRTTSPLRGSKPVIALSTYDTVRSSIDKLAKIPFFYVLLDEATNIKNPTAQRSKAIKSLNSAYRLSLSGTPVENRPAELWSIYDFLMTGHLGQYGTFERVFENLILSGNQEAAEKLGRRIKPFMLRRLKEDVAKDLPQKIEMDEWCELTVEQHALYAEVQAQAKPAIDALRAGAEVSYTASILPVLTKLKQICDHPGIVNNVPTPLMGRSHKYDWIVERVNTILEGGDQVIVFSHFLGMLNLLEAAMVERRTAYIRLDGTTRNRQQLVDTFNAGDARVGLFSIRAAGHGISVTSANHVIHADRWWNPAVENQATDRVHRIGQTKTVFVYRIMVENTLEERIEKLLERKQGIADQIVDAARKGPQQWSREELLALLRPLE
jgi:SNF2 family DNA or RNA helicase